MALGAEARGLLIQRDTYFHAEHGRLKLREDGGAKAQLIAYEREDRTGHRESRYRIVPIEDAETLRAALESTLGVKAVIAKARQLLIWKGVRIHIDRVEGLGDFLEFEAVMTDDSGLTEAEGRIATLRDAVGIEDADLIGESYCDLARGGDGA